MPKSKAVLLLGSNINPQENILAAIQMIQNECRILKKSRTWITESYGSEGPDFLNIALMIESTYSLNQLRTDLISRIETGLRRIRTADKNAPRTIDVDVIWFNDEIIDDSVFTKLFVALPVSELMPEVMDDRTKEKLSAIAEKLKSSTKAELFQGKII